VVNAERGRLEKQPTKSIETLKNYSNWRTAKEVQSNKESPKLRRLMEKTAYLQ